MKDQQSLRDAIRDADHKSVVVIIRGGKEEKINVTFDRTMGFESDEEKPLVTTVLDNTPASKAGLKAGDLIVKFDGKDVKDMQGLRAAMRDGPKKAKLVVTRDGKPVELEVEFER